MTLHKEISFEDEICAHLAAHGWLYEPVDAARYDRQRALFPADLIAWVQQTQPKAWEALGRSHGAGAEVALLDRVRKQIDDRGALDIIRHGVDMVGVKGRIALAQFRPAFGMNPDIIAAYQANRLRVVRQLRYSAANENAIDVALFLNGIGGNIDHCRSSESQKSVSRFPLRCNRWISRRRTFTISLTHRGIQCPAGSSMLRNQHQQYPADTLNALAVRNNQLDIHDLPFSA